MPHDATPRQETDNRIVRMPEKRTDHGTIRKGIEECRIVGIGFVGHLAFCFCEF